MIIQRQATYLLEERLNQFPVVAVLGARQCGKTTLVKQLQNNGWQYFDLENTEHYERIKNDPLFFFRQHPHHVIIDEAQLCPQIFAVLRGIIDEDRQYKGRFILTGSSSPDLQKNMSESLAGRMTTIELSPLKVNEFYQAPLSDFYEIFEQPFTRTSIDSVIKTMGSPPFTLEQIQHVWFYGGYPEPTLANDINFYQSWMQAYRDTYINRDIKQLFPQLNVFAYQRFLNMLSHLSNTILNRSDIARSLEISEKTVRDYLKIIEGTYLWRMLPSYEKASIKTIVKMPKGHMQDTGLLHFLLKINSLDDLYNHPIVGHSFEGFVIEELLKGLNNKGIVNTDAYYYRTRTGIEVDLILEGFFGVLPIEIKYGSVVISKQLKNLKSFIEKNKLPFGILINQSSEITWLTEKILQIPVGCL